MKFKTVFTLLLCLFLTAGVPPFAAAAARAPYDDYRSARYYRGRDRDEIVRRAILRDRLLDAASWVKEADRRGDISRRQAGSLFRRLDRVADLLRCDRYITDAEFQRWRNDLRDVLHDLRRDAREGHRRYRY